MSVSKTFNDIMPPLNTEILEVLKEQEFVTVTPVQGAVIPYFLSHKDVNVCACTGSGKTLAFLIPVFQILDKGNSSLNGGRIGAIIISPTRELANQTYMVATRFEERIPFLHVVLFTGGNEVADDMKELESDKGLIVIATPGRLKDIIERKGDRFPVRDLEVLILDEADVLLDLGHTTAITYILSRIPKQRRTGLFSATQTDAVSSLCKAGLRNPVKINIEIKNKNKVQAVPVSLKNYVVMLTSDLKLGYLIDFIQSHREEKVIVFFLTCAAVDFFYMILHDMEAFKGVRLLSLHGRMVQKKRIKTMESFREAIPSILLCTDVAARGIDVPDIDWIIQYSPPQDPSFFIHRVGRTARAGKKGSSLLLIEPSEIAYIAFTKKRGVPLQSYPVDSKSESMVCIDPEVQKKWREQLLRIREICSKNREYYEKSVMGFVADIRAYRNHDCNFILRFDDLDLSAMARSYCLVRLPKMSEFKKRKVEYDEMDIDVYNIPYLDDKREKARAERQKKELSEKEKRDKKKEEKKSIKKEREGEDEKRKRKGKHERIMNEWEELQEEERLYRLYKNHKIDEDEYEKKLFSASVIDSDDGNDEQVNLLKAAKDLQMKKNNRKNKQVKNKRKMNHFKSYSLC